MRRTLWRLGLRVNGCRCIGLTAEGVDTYALSTTHREAKPREELQGHRNPCTKGISSCQICCQD